MTSVKTKNAALLLLGAAAGGILASAVWFDQVVELEKQYAALNSDHTTLAKGIEAKELALSVSASQHEKTQSNVEKLVVQLQEKDKELAELEHKITMKSRQSQSQNSEQTEKLLESEKALEALRTRLQNTDRLYAERFRLTKAVNELNENILKASHKAEASQKACDEFKKGNSWNRVSQDDCDTYAKMKKAADDMIEEFDVISSQLDSVNRQLSAFGNLPLVNKDATNEKADKAGAKLVISN
ncbi:hypothetical protein [Enterovibrio norvegicus]|uniref:hypothetical protein n=1 Tax=Enterovibrio norvegicus TaxID=188144 RepID=UPI0013D74CCD|nr:hypothetical protein [Enterovibrio norvegicus]